MTELIARSTTTNFSYSGIKGSVQVPAAFTVPRSDEYINFYLGLNGNAGHAIEGGISYGTRNGVTGWRYFLNNGDSTQFQSIAYPGGLSAGQVVPIQIEILSGVAYLTVNGQYKLNVAVATDVANPSQGKQVIAAVEQVSGNVTHAKVVFSNIQLKSGANWYAWSSSTATNTPYTNTPRYVLGNTTGIPLTATLTQ